MISLEQQTRKAAAALVYQSGMVIRLGIGSAAIFAAAGELA
jgi:hypothetical protein